MERTLVFGIGGHWKLIEHFVLNPAFVEEGTEDELAAKAFATSWGNSGDKLYGLVNCGWVDSTPDKRVQIWNIIKRAGLRPWSNLPNSEMLRIDRRTYRQDSNPHSYKYGSGCIVMHRSFVGPDCRLGNNVLINVGALLPHDVVVGSHTHIAPGAILAAGVVVGVGCLIGMGVTVYKNVKIGNNAVICNGTNVFTDIERGRTVWPGGKGCR